MVEILESASLQGPLVFARDLTKGKVCFGLGPSTSLDFHWLITEESGPIVREEEIEEHPHLPLLHSP